MIKLRQLFRRSNGRIGPEEVFLIVALILFVVYIAFVFFSPTFKDWSQTLWEQSLRLSQQHGYWGAVIFSFLAHTTIIIPVPYTILIVFLGSTGLNVLWLGLLAGVGASIGELTSYITGLFGGTLVWKKYNKQFLSLRRILERRPKLMPWLIFIFGVSPLPDDVLLIPLGMIRYNFFKAVIPMMIGKIILTTIFAFTGQAAAPIVDQLIYQPDLPWASLLTLFFVIISVYIIIKIDWQKLGELIMGEARD